MKAVVVVLALNISSNLHFTFICLLNQSLQVVGVNLVNLFKSFICLFGVTFKFIFNSNIIISQPALNNKRRSHHPCLTASRHAKLTLPTCPGCACEPEGGRKKEKQVNRKTCHPICLPIL